MEDQCFQKADEPQRGVVEVARNPLVMIRLVLLDWHLQMAMVLLDPY